MAERFSGALFCHCSSGAFCEHYLSLYRVLDCLATAASACCCVLLPLLQNAYNLGWKLARVLQQGASPQLLDSYAAEAREAAGQQQ